MTKLDVIKNINGITEFSRIVFDMVQRAENAEQFEQDLASEIPEEGLQTIRSIAQNGSYPLSLDGLQ